MRRNRQHPRRIRTRSRSRPRSRSRSRSASGGPRSKSLSPHSPSMRFLPLADPRRRLAAHERRALHAQARRPAHSGGEEDLGTRGGDGGDAAGEQPRVRVPAHHPLAGREQRLQVGRAVRGKRRDNRLADGALHTPRPDKPVARPDRQTWSRARRTPTAAYNSAILCNGRPTREKRCANCFEPTARASQKLA